MNTLKFHSSNLTYPGAGSNVAVTGLDLELAPGRALALIGPNGAGKTTFLKAILGQVHASGTAEVLGREPGNAPSGSIGYVPQLADLDATFPVRARDVVTMGLIHKQGLFGRLKSADAQRVDSALTQVDLLDKAQQRFGTMSGGQKQRVLLARAIAAQPKLILLDEPFNGLDQPNRDALLRIIEVVKAEGVSVVVSTHDISLAEAVAEQLLLLAGRQVACGSLKEVMTDANMAAAYGGRAREVATEIACA